MLKIQDVLSSIITLLHWSPNHIKSYVYPKSGKLHHDGALGIPCEFTDPVVKREPKINLAISIPRTLHAMPKTNINHTLYNIWQCFTMYINSVEQQQQQQQQHQNLAFWSPRRQLLGQTLHFHLKKNTGEIQVRTEERERERFLGIITYITHKYPLYIGFTLGFPINW